MNRACPGGGEGCGIGESVAERGGSNSAVRGSAVRGPAWSEIIFRSKRRLPLHSGASEATPGSAWLGPTRVARRRPRTQQIMLTDVLHHGRSTGLEHEPHADCTVPGLAASGCSESFRAPVPVLPNCAWFRRSATQREAPADVANESSGQRASRFRCRPAERVAAGMARRYRLREQRRAYHRASGPPRRPLLGVPLTLIVCALLLLRVRCRRMVNGVPDNQKRCR